MGCLFTIVRFLYLHQRGVALKCRTRAGGARAAVGLVCGDVQLSIEPRRSVTKNDVYDMFVAYKIAYTLVLVHNIYQVRVQVRI